MIRKAGRKVNRNGIKFFLIAAENNGRFFAGDAGRPYGFYLTFRQECSGGDLPPKKV